MSTLTLALKIDAALGKNFRAVFESGKREMIALETIGKRLNEQQKTFSRTLAEAGISNSESLARMRRGYRDVAEQIDRVVAAERRLENASRWHDRVSGNLGQARSDLGSRLMTGGMVALPAVGIVKAYMDQERAATDLKIAMMDKNGAVGAFDKLNKIVIDLGNTLPGTTEDFYRLAQVMKSKGISDERLLNGGLKTSAYLNVLMDMDQTQGGIFFDNMMHAFGLKEKDFRPAADLVQRTHFGFGAEKDDMQYAMQYMAPSLNSMGLTGIDNMKKLMALQGEGSSWHYEGSSFGTNFAMFLSQLAEGPGKLQQSKRGMKSEARDMLNATGVDFNFFDKKGKFLGLDSMIGQLSQLDKIKAKYGDKGVMIVTKELFGQEAGRIAQLFYAKGMTGYQNNLKQLDNQASLDQRIALKSSTLANKFENLTGTTKNLAATIGEMFKPELASLFTTMNDFIGGPLTKWVTGHKSALKTTAELLAGLMGLRIGMAVARVGFWLFLSPVAKLWKGLAKLRAMLVIFQALRLAGGGRLAAFFQAFGMGAKWAARFAKVFAKIPFLMLELGRGLLIIGRGFLFLARIHLAGLATTLLAVGRAFLWLGRGLLLNPIGLIITGIAIAGYLIYKHWDKVAPVLKTVWSALKTGYAWAVKQTSSLIEWFAKLPQRFVDFGRNVVDGLINGIKQRWQALKDTVSGMGESIAISFKSTLGIHSPSRVFMGFGHNIAQGAAIGIHQGKDVAINAARDMAQHVTHSASGSISGARGAAGGMSIQFSPQITIQGNASQSDVENALNLSLRDLEKLIDRVTERKARRAYA